MIEGPDQIIECPNCAALARVFTLVSGNTSGATRWTDGKMIAPMLPEPPAIIKCSACGGFYWLSDARVIGELPTWGAEPDQAPDDWKSAEHVRELSESEYLQAIAAGAAHNTEQELHLRINAWWAGNDPLRSDDQVTHQQPKAAPTRSTAAITNLERLLEQLDTNNPDDRLMQAELLRELGRFEDATTLLNADFPPNYTKPASFIRGLAKNKDPIVRQIID
jgi:hypothetical protein